MSFFIDENGQSIVEYALVLGLIAIVSLVVLLAFGPKIRNVFNGANDAVDKAK
ncbi:MAG: Flp family type IVb pilin [Eubacterium sp.]|nr:Flp family type IVb pilin [Eubacterium sp.]